MKKKPIFYWHALLLLLCMSMPIITTAQTLNLGNISPGQAARLQINQEALRSYGVNLANPAAEAITVNLNSPINGIRTVTNADVYFVRIGGDGYFAVPLIDGVLLRGASGIRNYYSHVTTNVIGQIESGYASYRNAAIINSGSVPPIGGGFPPPIITTALDVQPITQITSNNISWNASGISGGSASFVPSPIFALEGAYSTIRNNTLQGIAKPLLNLPFVSGPASSIQTFYNYIFQIAADDGNSVPGNFANIRDASVIVAAGLRYLNSKVYQVRFRNGEILEETTNINPQLINQSVPDEGTQYALNKNEAADGIFTYETKYRIGSQTRTAKFISDNMNLALSPPVNSIDFTKIEFSSDAGFLKANSNLNISDIKGYSEKIDWRLNGLRFQDFDGVDFTNLSVAGIGVDEGTKTVNFIMEGKAVTGNGGRNLKNVANVQKKAFFQALSIPNSKQFVDMDIIKDANGNNKGYARADEQFKKTDICVTFFRADEQMKKDLNRAFTGLGTANNVYRDWDNLLRENMTLYRKMVKNYSCYPQLTSVSVRGLIVPELPTGGDDNQRVFIADSQYRLQRFLENIAIQTLNHRTGASINRSSLPADIKDYLNQKLNKLNNKFLQRLNLAADIVENKINQGTHQTYKQLNVILPSLVAAQWYKLQPIASKQFGSLINSSDLSAKHTGISLAAAAPFDQNFWDNKSYQNIVSGNVTINLVDGMSFAFRSTVRGGVQPAANFNNIDNINTTETGIFNRTSGAGATANSQKNYVNAGPLDHKLPELAFNFLRMLPASSNYDHTSYEKGKNTQIKYSIINTGKVAPSLVQMEFYWRRLNNRGLPVDDQLNKFRTIIRSMPNGIFKELQGTIDFRIPSFKGNMEIIGVVSYPKSGFNIGPEVTLSNNVAQRKYRIGATPTYIAPVIYREKTFTSNSNEFGSFVVTAKRVLVPSAKTVTFRGRDYIDLQPGFEAVRGSTFTAQISNPFTGNNFSAPEEVALDLQYEQVSADILKPNYFVFEEEIKPKEYQTVITFLGADGTPEEEILLEDIEAEVTEELPEFSVYPVPFNDLLNVNLSAEKSPVSIQILDYLGSQVFNKTLNIQDRSGLQINTARFAKGAYIILVDYEDGSREISKIIK